MTKEELWVKCGIGEAYHTTSIETFRGEDKNALGKFKEYIANLDKARDGGVGVFAYGPNGTGKTFLCCEILKAAMEKTNPKTRRPYTVFKTSLAKIVTAMTRGWYDDATRLEFERTVVGRDFLFIDDVEKAFVREGSATALQVAAVDMVLRERIERQRPVLITSNQKPQVLTDAFGPSVGSLLRGNMLLIPFEGNDYRSFDTAKKKWEGLLD